MFKFIKTHLIKLRLASVYRLQWFAIVRITRIYMQVSYKTFSTSHLTNVAYSWRELRSISIEVFFAFGFRIFFS